jgi:hypothetical protein
MNTIDIADLNYAELVQLREAVSERMKEMRDTGITQLKATIAEQASILGIDLRELMPRKTRRRRKSEDTE